jgi:hypothetical protein
MSVRPCQGRFQMAVIVFFCLLPDLIFICFSIDFGGWVRRIRKKINRKQNAFISIFGFLFPRQVVGVCLTARLGERTFSAHAGGTRRPTVITRNMTNSVNHNCFVSNCSTVYISCPILIRIWGKVDKIWFWCIRPSDMEQSFISRCRICCLDDFRQRMNCICYCRRKKYAWHIFSSIDYMICVRVQLSCG